MRAAGSAAHAVQQLRLPRQPPRGLPRSRPLVRGHPRHQGSRRRGRPTRLQNQHRSHPPPRSRRSAPFLRRYNQPGSPHRLRPQPRERWSHSRRRLNRRPALPTLGVLLHRAIRTPVTRIRPVIPVFHPRGQGNTPGPTYLIPRHLEQAHHRTAHRDPRLEFLHHTRRPTRILTRHSLTPSRGPNHTQQGLSRRSLTDHRCRWCRLIPSGPRYSRMQPESHARRCVRAASSS
jgi:hypothetical protein